MSDALLLEEKSPDYFTEQGRLGGQKSGEVRRERAQLVSQFEALRPFLQPLLKPQVNQTDSLPQPNTHAIETLEAQIQRIDKVMEGELTPKDWNQAAQAKTRLIEAWCWLSGVPKPVAPKDGGRRAARLQINLPQEPAQSKPGS